MSNIISLKSYDNIPNWKDSGLFIVTSGGSFLIDASMILLPSNDNADNILFLYTESGSASLLSGDSEILVPAGRCIIAECGDRPAITSSSRSMIHAYTFCGIASTKTLGLIGFGPSKALITDYSTVDRRNLLLQLTELDGLKDSEEEISVLLRSQIFQNIITKLVKMNYYERHTNVDETSLPWHIKICIDFIKKNYASDISLDVLASECGINKYTLSRDFTSLIGNSPIQYLKERRIDVAKEYLRNSSLSIRDVGIAAGIPDTTHFIRMFKKCTGTTPLKYRNRYL